MSSGDGVEVMMRNASCFVIVFPVDGVEVMMRNASCFVIVFSVDDKLYISIQRGK